MAQRTVALCDGKFIGIESIYTVIDGKQINIPDKLEQLRAKSRNNELFCPCGCGANLVLVAGERNLREQHFRIKEGFDGICQMPVEGINSIDSKIALKCWLEDKLHTDDIESRVPIRTVSESERKYEFTFMSAKKKVALSFCNEYRNLSDDKFTILEQHSNGNSIIYVASGDKSETNGQYPEGLMKIQKRQGYCLLLNVDGADYSKAELTVVYYEKNADGVWEKVNIARDKLSKFDISDSSQIMYHNHSLSDMLKEKQLEFNKHKQAIIYQRELDKIHAEEAWRADEERRKQARIKAEKDRKAELERREKERIKLFLIVNMNENSSKIKVKGGEGYGMFDKATRIEIIFNDNEYIVSNPDEIEQIIRLCRQNWEPSNTHITKEDCDMCVKFIGTDTEVWVDTETLSSYIGESFVQMPEDLFKKIKEVVSLSNTPRPGKFVYKLMFLKFSRLIF